MVKTRVLEILTALAAGADPFTGEELPEKHVCQKADVVRALHVAIARVERWKDRKLPAQAGKPWSTEEEEKLEKAHGKGRSIREIATELERTTGAVHSRLLRLGLIEVP